MRALRDYADKNDYKVVREYVDEAESGRVMNRPEFQQDAGRGQEGRVALSRRYWSGSSPASPASGEHAVALKSMLVNWK